MEHARHKITQNCCPKIQKMQMDEETFTMFLDSVGFDKNIDHQHVMNHRIQQAAPASTFQVSGIGGTNVPDVLIPIASVDNIDNGCQSSSGTLCCQQHIVAVAAPLLGCRSANGIDVAELQGKPWSLGRRPRQDVLIHKLEPRTPKDPSGGEASDASARCLCGKSQASTKLLENMFSKECLSKSNDVLKECKLEKDRALDEIFGGL